VCLSDTHAVECMMRDVASGDRSHTPSMHDHMTRPTARKSDRRGVYYARPAVVLRAARFWAAGGGALWAAISANSCGDPGIRVNPQASHDRCASRSSRAIGTSGSVCAIKLAIQQRLLNNPEPLTRSHILGAFVACARSP
jgi:hypothetical protein